MLTKCKTALARAGAFVSRPFRALWHLMRANQLQTNLWLLFAATPFICFLMVELLAENKICLLYTSHADNRTMQHLLEKHGFVYCGIVNPPDGGERMAYQLAVTKN